MADETTAQVLSHALGRFEYLEDFEQVAVAEHFNCPSLNTCELDNSEGLSMRAREHVCSMCKVRWLLSEWEG